LRNQCPDLPHQTLLFLSKNFADCLAYFLRTQICKQLELAFAFSAFRFLSSVEVVRASFLGTRLYLHQNSAFALSKCPWHTVELIFSTLSLAIIETCFCFFLVSTMNFEKATSYFSTSNLAFSQSYVHRVELTFF
jgi:hypothetical protein